MSNDMRAIKPLIGLLDDDHSPEIRKLVITSLQNFDTPEVKDALYSTLNNQDESVRIKAAQALIKMGETPERLLPDLIQIIKSEDVKLYKLHIKEEAMETLIKIKDPEASSFLLSYLQDKKNALELRAIAANALANTEREKTQEVFLDVLNSPRNIKPELRDEAIYNLGEIGNSRAIDSLKKFLECSEDNRFQANALAISSLKKIDPLKTEQILFDLFKESNDIQYRQPIIIPGFTDWDLLSRKNNDIQYRQTIILGFAGWDSPKANDFLLNRLKDKHPEIRLAAINSLSDRITRPEVKDSFINLARYDKSPFVRTQAIFGLRNIDDLKVTETLKFALNDPYPQVKSAAIVSLAPRADFDTMNKIAKFSSDPNLMLQRTATFSLGQRLADFPQNADYLIPKLKDNDWQMRQIAMSGLGANIDKLPQLKPQFLNIANDKLETLAFQQTALLSLSKINEPEIKNTVIDKLSSPNWQMRQTAVLALSKFNEPQTIDYIIPKLEDPAWQVRQTAAYSLSNFNSLKAMDSLVPSLNDNHLEVRRTAVLPIASNLKAFPELKQPLMNTFENKYEDKWVRSIAGTSLKNAGYSVDFNLEGIKPLGKSMAIFMPGFDNPNPFDAGRPQGESWLKNDKIGQDFYKLEKIGVGVVDEFDWSGNIQDIGKAQENFKSEIGVRYNRARELKMDSVTFIGNSAGGLYSDKGINYFKILDADYMKQHPSETRIKINILVGGSPLVQNDMVFRQLAKDTGGQYKPVWSPIDPLSWPVAFKPNSQMILSRHQDYFNNFEFRQTGLSMSTGMDIPIAYSRTAYGTISDPYFSATFKIQETKSIYSSGIISYRTQSWYSYNSGRGLTSSISPFSSPLQQPAYSRPTIPTGVGRSRI